MRNPPTSDAAFIMDEIGQKIEEFKRSLDSQSPLKEILFSCPAVLPAVGLIAGLIIQFYFDLPLWAFLAILMIIIFFYLGRHAGLPLHHNQRFIFISVFLCFVCLGSIRLINFNRPASNDIRALAGNDFTFAHIKGQIISKPEIIENNDWHFSRFYHYSAHTAFYAKVTDVKTKSGWAKATGTIKFYISGKTNRFNIGDKFQTFCGLDKFSPADNPGQFDTARYMHRNDVFLSGSVKSADAITVLGKENLKPLFDLKAKLNEYATAWLNDDREDNGDRRLVEAMVLGSRTKIDRKLYNDFIKTGLVHLVCLSGLNVGIFAGVAWWLSKRAGLLYRGRAIASILATIVFLLVVPAQSSTLRAGIMFIVFCLARFFYQRSSLLNSIALSAIFLLLINPMDFLSPGFQLSFGATIGIVLFCPVFFNFLIIPFGDSNKNFILKFLKALLAAFSTGCTAWLFVAPIIAWNFFQVQLYTAVWTVPAMVPATIIIVLGTFKIILNPILPTIAYGLGFVIDFSADVLAYLVTIFAKVPLSHFIIGKPSIFIIIFFYIMLFMWKFFPFKSFGKKFIYPASLIILFVPLVFSNKVENNDLRLAILSVGHGQTCVLSLPGGENIIIDAGSMSQSNVGEKTINPYLDYAAIRKIDSVFISHDDIDHFNGLPEILNKHKYENIYTTPQLIASDSGTVKELKKLYSLKAAPEKISHGKASITRLWPIDTMIDYSDNESSLVLLVEYCGRKILFSSDITADVQKQLMDLYSQIDIDVLITPHHGSPRTTDANFINYFKPEYLITSCSESQLERISKAIKSFTKSYFTCSDGAITVLIDSGGKIKLTTFK